MDFRKGQPLLSLDGEWSFAFTSAFSEALNVSSRSALEAAGLNFRPCSVPGNLELDLLAAGLINDPFQGMNTVALMECEDYHVWYVRRFDAGALAGSRGELVFNGIDCLADIYLNGKPLGSVDNMLVEHVFDVTGLLRRDNELLVHIRPAMQEASRYDYPPGVAAGPVNRESLFVRKAPHMYGWDIMPRAVSAGIWRSVFLRGMPEERLERVFLATTAVASGHAEASLRLDYVLHVSTGAGRTCEILLTASCGESSFEHRFRPAVPSGAEEFNVASPVLWWPAGYGSPALYDVNVTLLMDGAPVDSLAFGHGIRTVELLRTGVTNAAGDGEFVFMLNGVRVFAKGTNWVPLDAYHSRDLARIPAALDLAVECRCNIIRCWGGNVYEHDLFYEICDRSGIMVWQDFAMACAVYPQDREFQDRLAGEAVKVVRRLRQHPCIILWSGDNECDWSYTWFKKGDPNANVLTRGVLPAVLAAEDPSRPYIPSSPYMDEEACAKGIELVPESHLWGPRDYYKSPFYLGAVCHFVSEIGYHGCPSPDSVRRFISPDKVWPFHDNEEWVLHSTNPVPGRSMLSPPDQRVQLMVKQILALFGRLPDNLEDFSFASQATQAEAKKFFIERFRSGMWRRTGIIWWNLLDGWPQFSDAVVDYYFRRKLAFHYIARSQQDVCLMLAEPDAGAQRLIASNSTLADASLSFNVKDVATGEMIAESHGLSPANSAVALLSIPFDESTRRMYLISWQGDAAGSNHYLAGVPPFDLVEYRSWLADLRIVPETE
ncbi:MAG: glycoside hydrolase family 2 [Planctomycetes bacterium]|nr:glycoside hydrolase family 2 [Planctomycetota bacterium]